MPHTAPSSLSSRRGLSQLRTGWSAPAASFSNAIPLGTARDVSGFGFLQFRATVNFEDARNPFAMAQDLSMRLTDGFGGSATVRVGQFSDALFYPPGTQSAVPKVLHNAVRLPLSAWTGVNLANISEVALLFDQRSSGALLISDLHFYRQPGAEATGHDYFTLAPCRVFDTRITASPLAANTSRTFAVGGLCGVPGDAVAVAANVTAVNPQDQGDLRVYPTGTMAPLASIVNFGRGRTRANNAILALGAGGQIDMLCDMPPGSPASTHLVLDVTGYFR
jgi:hypothetical protein